MQHHRRHPPHCWAQQREETSCIGARPFCEGVTAGGRLLEHEATAGEFGDVPTAIGKWNEGSTVECAGGALRAEWRERQSVAERRAVSGERSAASGQRLAPRGLVHPEQPSVLHLPSRLQPRIILENKDVTGWPGAARGVCLNDQA